MHKNNSAWVIKKLPEIVSFKTNRRGIKEFTSTIEMYKTVRMSDIIKDNFKTKLINTKYNEKSKKFGKYLSLENISDIPLKIDKKIDDYLNYK